MDHRTDYVLAKITSLQSTMELCKWNQLDTEVALFKELAQQEKKLQDLFKKVVGTQSVQIKEKWDKLIEHIDTKTKAENMPTDDKDTYLKNVENLNNTITTKRLVIEDLITRSQTTEVAPAA